MNNVVDETINLLNKRTLKEDSRSQTVEIGNARAYVYTQDQLDCYNAIKNRLQGLESNVTAFNIDLMLQDHTYVEFKTDDNAGEFIVIFSTEDFGKVLNVQTTFSNQEITQDFLTLSNELYKLKN